ncbi:MAG: hypothetical protein WAU75_10865 [Solirubrobacteraceae bacterium]
MLKVGRQRRCSAFGSDLTTGRGGPGGGAGLTRSVDAIIARGQALVDAPRTEAGRPLAWHVEAMLIGDLTAVAAAAARAARAAREGP